MHWMTLPFWEHSKCGNLYDGGDSHDDILFLKEESKATETRNE